MSAVPSACGDCPMVGTAKGFALHSGALPPKSGICILLEAPGPNDCIFLVKELIDGANELQRRSSRYPQLEDKWIRMGAHATSWDDTIATLWNWMLLPMGLQRSDVALFSTLNCYPGRSPDKKLLYPKDKARKRAEATCAELWLQPLIEWNPTVSVVGMLLAGRSDSTPLPVAKRAIEKAKMFAAKGERVLLLLGGRATKHWLSYGENASRWAGHWQAETALTRRLRRERWDSNRRLSVEKKAKREKKLTLKQWLQKFRERYVFDEQLGEPQWHMPIPPTLTPHEYEYLSLLCEPAKKKSKEEVASVSS